MDDLRLVLASGSPRRRELLQRLSLDFAVTPPDIDETVLTNESPAAYVQRLALEKATTVARPGAVVIGADTSVVLDGEILGKPTSRSDAATTLARLSGRSHEAITGVAVVMTTHDGDRRTAAGVESTVVTFEHVSRRRIEWYLDTGEPDDKAGSYALQGAGSIFADRIDGSVTNVIGIPLPLLDGLCDEVDVDLLSFRGAP